jgi:hypothetical protein
MVRDRYADARRDAMVALDEARGDDEQYKRAIDSMRERRAAVARLLDATGGSAVPGQPTDWYWEEYDAPDGADHDIEYLVFARLDVSMDALRRLVDRYQVPVDVRGSQALTVFPSLAWNHPELGAGALILEAGGALARLGVQRGDIVTAVGGESVRDASALAESVAAGGQLSLTVTGRDGEIRQLGAGD